MEESPCAQFQGQTQEEMGKIRMTLNFLKGLRMMPVGGEEKENLPAKSAGMFQLGAGSLWM